jgi:hypothetical protein
MRTRGRTARRMAGRAGLAATTRATSRRIVYADGAQYPSTRARRSGRKPDPILGSFASIRRCSGCGRFALNSCRDVAALRTTRCASRGHLLTTGSADTRTRPQFAYACPACAALHACTRVTSHSRGLDETTQVRHASRRHRSSLAAARPYATGEQGLADRVVGLQLARGGPLAALGRIPAADAPSFSGLVGQRAAPTACEPLPRS